eukprot:2864104-Rhodomonas_salina.2
MTLLAASLHSHRAHHAQHLRLSRPHHSRHLPPALSENHAAAQLLAVARIQHHTLHGPARALRLALKHICNGAQRLFLRAVGRVRL